MRLRNARTLNYQRLGLAVVLLALVPVATQLPSLVTLAGVTGLFWLLIGFETRRYSERRTQLRHDHLHPGGRPGPGPATPAEQPPAQEETGRPGSQ
jgi:hypothetical protein